MRLYIESHDRAMTVKDLRRFISNVTPGDDDIPIWFQNGIPVKYLAWEDAPDKKPDARFVIG